MTVLSGLSLQTLQGRDVISSAPPVMKSASAASEHASSRRRPSVSDKTGRNLKLGAAKNQSQSGLGSPGESELWIGRMKEANNSNAHFMLF